MDLSEKFFGSCCPKCHHNITIYEKDINKYIECPNCNKHIFIYEDDFLDTFENIKRQITTDN